MDGIKHLIECHCILPQYRGSKDPVYHKFVTFSIIDKSDTVIPKYVQCNNCGAVHKITDICKSEIITGKDELRSCATIKDISMTMNESVSDILETYNCDISSWEHSKFILDYKKWGSFIVLTRDEFETETHGKMLVFEDDGVFKIEPFIMRRVPD
jgi:hypothetical protein